MRIMRALILASCLFSAACFGLVPIESHVVADAQVKSVEVPDAFAGGIASYLAFNLQVGKKQIRLYYPYLYYPYLSGEPMLPRVGDTCEFAFDMEVIDGVVGRELIQPTELPVIQSFTCSKNTPAQK